MIGPLPGLSSGMQSLVYAATASPNGPIVNCAACSCDVYGGVRHRMGEGKCSVQWYDHYPEPQRSEIIELLRRKNLERPA